MIAFKDLEEVLKLTLKWENALKDFYDVAEYALKDTEAKDAVKLLREKLVEKLEILEGVDVKSFGMTRWIRYAPAYRDEDLIPIGRIKRDTSAEEIFDHLLDYEKKLETTYATIAEKLVSRGHKELFESLVQFKEEQIEEIRALKAAHLAGK